MSSATIRVDDAPDLANLRTRQNRVFRSLKRDPGTLISITFLFLVVLAAILATHRP
jgi:hypothetical protein